MDELPLRHDRTLPAAPACWGAILRKAPCLVWMKVEVNGIEALCPRKRSPIAPAIFSPVISVVPESIGLPFLKFLR